MKNPNLYYVTDLIESRIQLLESLDKSHMAEEYQKYNQAKIEGMRLAIEQVRLAYGLWEKL